ncbi:MAG TPA: acetyl-CoA decarbonylase/synthase complex subunit gamma [Methanoregulaceae archaeon]|nr:MAG: acetyl-CoA decarbonylase/synthase complex subunit gamma [Methanolinea sp.]HON81767.1 acetyl-CoA decarbonylase/synthase complex subunit gamma [Methanoregulaceae archaeon]HPD10575.1 acetyl-CoA decarbonylase/synthase complex subunit gamma [Methanoregulaceae archaeon]HRT15576.1 acetyl-CoA decarbonylase/synthase complex subunit gamma [Methanoregulaceae archaeon]HRU31148.1 acetyl-CoA decarbonylase/synthase complex subunit gamma [Methanoregulaceae archaeon]
MALKALDIYKLLPKKNCKECGEPTCLTFAMKLAGGKVKPEDCPYLDEEVRELLGASTRPPVQRVRLGVGERSFTVGDEIVLFRHEKTFFHEPGIMTVVSDRMDADTIQKIVADVRDHLMVRIGLDLRMNGIAVCSESGSPSAFGKAVEAVETIADLPEVLMAQDPAVQEAGLAVCGNYRPLIHAADESQYREMCALAARYGCPLAIRAPDLDALTRLSGLCAAEGASHLVLDLTSHSLHETLNSVTAVRQHAITRTTPALGYPVFIDTRATGLTDAALICGVLKYGSVLVADVIAPATRKAFLVLRQNIYTDPQKPIQITPGIYKVGDPGPDAPVFLTVNFSLTYFTLQGYLEASGRDSLMLIVDTEGLSVLTAVASGKLSESLVKESLNRFGVPDLVSHRTLIIPGYAAPLSGRIEDETGWKVLVGPRDAADIAEFLEKEWT